MCYFYILIMVLSHQSNTYLLIRRKDIYFTLNYLLPLAVCCLQKNKFLWIFLRELIKVRNVPYRQVSNILFSLLLVFMELMTVILSDLFFPSTVNIRLKENFLFTIILSKNWPWIILHDTPYPIFLLLVFPHGRQHMFMMEDTAWIIFVVRWDQLFIYVFHGWMMHLSCYICAIYGKVFYHALM